MRTLALPARPAIRRTGGAGVTKALAVTGGVITAWCLWGVVAWLADGPAAITQFREPGSGMAVTARMLEIAVVLVAVVVARHVVRGCLRERRLTFDAMFCIAGAVTMLLDPTTNFLQPVFFYNSNFVNLGSWCGHLPGVVNPDCGGLPQPVLFDFLVYTFALLPAAALLGGLMRRFGVGRGLLCAVAVELVVEIAAVMLHVWGYPGSPAWTSITGDGHRLPLHSVAGGTIFFFSLTALRFFRDDTGRSIAERGTRRVVISQLALIGAFQLALLAGNVLINLGGFYADPYPAMPASFVNGMCDAPGTSGTRYGPCPGSPGFRMPVRSLEESR
jgi:hypothetical protein